MQREKILDAIADRGEMNARWVLIRKTINDGDDGLLLDDYSADTSLFVEVMAVGDKWEIYSPFMAAFSRKDSDYGVTTFCRENPAHMQFFGTLNDEIGKIDESYFVIREDELVPVLFDGTPEALGDYVVFVCEKCEDSEDGVALPDKAVDYKRIADVTSVGPECRYLDVGDLIYTPRDFICVEIDGIVYGLMPEKDICAKVE